MLGGFFAIVLCKTVIWRFRSELYEPCFRVQDVVLVLSFAGNMTAVYLQMLVELDAATSATPLTSLKTTGAVLQVLQICLLVIIQVQSVNTCIIALF